MTLWRMRKNKKKNKTNRQIKKQENCKALFMMKPIKSANLKIYQAYLLIQQEMQTQTRQFLLKLKNNATAHFWTAVPRCH